MVRTDASEAGVVLESVHEVKARLAAQLVVRQVQHPQRVIACQGLDQRHTVAWTQTASISEDADSVHDWKISTP